MKTQALARLRALATSYETYIGIAANTVKELRKADVYRVLDECPAKDRGALAKYIVDNRPDLSLEVRESMLEL
jgi:hypothetical protein